MTSFRPSRSRSAIATWAICGRSSPFGMLPIARAVRSAVAGVEAGAVDGMVPAGAGSPPRHAVRPTAIAAIARRVLGPWFLVLGPSCRPRSSVHDRTKDKGLSTDQERRTKDTGLNGDEHPYGALFEDFVGA